MITLARDLAALITDAVPDVHVSLHQGSAVNAVMAGQAAVLIGPPSVEWVTTTQADLTWTVHVAAGSPDRETAWAQLDSIASLIHAAVGVDRVRPYDWRPTTGGDELPAYELTITSYHTT